MKRTEFCCRLFTVEEIEEIRSITLKSVIVQTTGIEVGELQDSVFFWRDGDPCQQPVQLSSDVLESCIPFMRYDHFAGNDVTYIFTCIALGIIPLGE